MSRLSLTVACWNTEWRRSRSGRGAALKLALLEHSPDVVCLPEAYNDFLAGDYYGIFSEPDHGYHPVEPDRSKVTLWSRWPWIELDQVGSPALPPGRFVAGTTLAPFGRIRVVGVCIPWRAAHVSTGRRDSAPWQEHERFLEALPGVLAKERGRHPLLLLGDFNQRIPAQMVPERLASTLQEAVKGLEVWTAGSIDGLDRQSLCHIAGAGHEWRLDRTWGASRRIANVDVSDHDGVFAAVSGI
jgi:hypothetical protein